MVDVVSENNEAVEEVKPVENNEVVEEVKPVGLPRNKEGY